MKSRRLIHMPMYLLLSCLTVLGSILGAHEVWAQDGDFPEPESAEQEAGKEPFWPAWNKFVKDVTESNLNNNPDPWEGMNRKIYQFNDTADRWVLKPVAKGYRWITPEPLEAGISNVFANLFEISTITNGLLQLKFLQAASDTGRFVINTTIGIAGLFDVATPLGLVKHHEDFGQTLGYWGVGSGPYVVVPFMGSYTLRSGTGSIIASQTTHYSHYIDHIRTRNQIFIVENVDRRANLLSAEELISGDRYSFIRDAYLQQREYLVNDGKVEDNFGEQDFEDWEDWEE